MRTKLTINIAEPCHENWNNMTPIQKGRHCASCNKTVHDFTVYSDEGLINTLKITGPICGRFTRSQLGREIKSGRNEKSGFFSAISSILFTIFSLNSYDVVAQGQPSIIQLDSIKKTKNKKDLASKNSIVKEITGTITTADDKLPLPGVNVLNKRTNFKTQSDFDGLFKAFCSIGDTLEFSFIGLGTERIIVKKDSIINIEMKEDFCQDNAYIVLGYPSYNWQGYYKRKCRQKERKAARIEKVKKIKNGEIRRSFVGRILYTLSYPFRSRD